MENPETRASPKQRAVAIVAGAVKLLLWLASWKPAIDSWGDPRADGFHLIPTFWATITALPLGVIALVGGVSGTEKGVRCARTSLMIAGGLAVVVAALKVVRQLAELSR